MSFSGQPVKISTSQRAKSGRGRTEHILQGLAGFPATHEQLEGGRSLDRRVVGTERGGCGLHRPPAVELFGHPAELLLSLSSTLGYRRQAFDEQRMQSG